MFSYNTTIHAACSRHDKNIKSERSEESKNTLNPQACVVLAHSKYFLYSLNGPLLCNKIMKYRKNRLFAFLSPTQWRLKKKKSFRSNLERKKEEKKYVAIIRKQRDHQLEELWLCERKSRKWKAIRDCLEMVVEGDLTFESKLHKRCHFMLDKFYGVKFWVINTVA